MRIRKKAIYVTACARGCNELVGDGLAIVLVLHHLGGRDGDCGLRLALLIAEDALLQAPELIILALLFQQLFVGAALYDLAVVHDQDEVTITDGGEAVGDDQHRAVCKLVVDHIKDGILCAKVQTAGGFVQNIEVRILQEGPGQCKALLLTAREAVAGFLQIGVVLQRQLADELVGICLLGSGLDLIEAGFRSGNADVVVDGLAEQLDVLGDIGDARRTEALLYSSSSTPPTLMVPLSGS